MVAHALQQLGLVSRDEFRLELAPLDAVDLRSLGIGQRGRTGHHRATGRM
jgi:hypothetical protein